MKKIIFLVVALVAAATSYQKILSWLPAQWTTHKIAYAQIKDITHPTVDDYARLQKFLSKGRRPELELLGDMKARQKNFCLIGKTPDELPRSGVIAVNCGENEKENCLLLYSSFNKNYVMGLERIIEHVSKSDFRGHILYRVGGWPNVEEGDLTLAHVPFAFKACFFREAQRLGYQRMLWLDTSILPCVSLNRIFDTIDKKGYFVIKNFHDVGPFMNEQAANLLGSTLEECSKIPSCQSGVLGLDMSKSHQVITDWYNAACRGAYFSPRSDQSALSVILYKLGIEEMEPAESIAEAHREVADAALFTIDRGFVQKW